MASQRQADIAMATYFNLLFEDGASQNVASYTLFGWIALGCAPMMGPERDQLPLSRAALTAWRGSTPSKARVGVPPQVIFSFALYCCQVQRFDAAAAVLLQFDLYARPSEILSVHGVDIIPPVAGLTPHWGVLFGNSDFSIPTKTGTYDDVVLADSKHRTFATQILRHISKMAKQTDNLIFPELNLATYEQLFRDFSKVHHLKAAIFTPHVIRHSGPSFDVMHQHRDFATVQFRGRWASFISVSRYKKPVRLLLHASQLPACFQKLQPEILQLALSQVLSHKWASSQSFAHLFICVCRQ